jgi:hypothetical protein
MWKWGRLVRVCRAIGQHGCRVCITVYRLYFKALGRSSTVIK